MAKENTKQSKVKSFFGNIGQGFSKISAKIKYRFRYLHPLVMMQLKDKIDFSFLKDRKKTLFKIIWSLVEFAVATAAIYLVFSLIVQFGLFSFLQTFNFRVFLVIMTILLILSGLSCLVNVTSTLYFAKDNPVLLTMPVKSSTIFSSKMIVCFIYELIKNFTFVWPFLIAYGLVMGLPFTYYLWSIFAILLITILILMVCGLLSIPAMGLAIIAKKYRVLELVVIAVVLSGIVLGVITAINKIPTDIDLVRDWGWIFWSLQDFLSGFAVIFAPFDYLLQLLTGMTYNGFTFTPFSIKNLITFAIVIGIIAVCMLITALLCKQLFLRMASTPFEYKKKVVKHQKKSHRKPPFVSAVAQQSKRMFRTPAIIYSILATAVIAPIAILLQNRIISAMDTMLTGMYMAIAFNVLIVMLMMLSTNNELASVFSREGNAAYLNKIYPVPYRVPLTGKLVLNMLICMVSIAVSVVVINIFSPLGIWQSILLTFAMILVYLAHLLWSAELDIMNPQNRQYQTTGKTQKNPNENKSTLLCFGMSAIFAFILYFFMSENAETVYIKILLIAAVTFAIRLYLYLTKIKLYYKEK